MPAYDTLRKSELKKLCKERGLPVSGLRADVIYRLRRYDTGDTSSAISNAGAEYAAHCMPKLIAFCRERSLCVSGTKADLVRRLLQYDQDILATATAQKAFIATEVVAPIQAAEQPISDPHDGGNFGFAHATAWLSSAAVSLWSRWRPKT